MKNFIAALLAIIVVLGFLWMLMFAMTALKIALFAMGLAMMVYCVYKLIRGML